MKKNQHLPITLIAVAILAGCATSKENPSLTDAHSRYDSARSNPQVTNLAALELKEASDSLSKADVALSKGEKADTVSHLAYIASQKVRIAEETANRKAAEQAVANASAERDRVRLEARTAEAGAAKQEAGAAKQEAGAAKQEADAARQEAEAAKQDAASMKETADQQAAAMAAASAKAERDQALIAQQEMQLKELNAKKTERGLVITLGDVLFSTNRAQLKPGSMRSIQKLADFLTQYPQRKVLIEGHTDSTGSISRNQELSEQRADAVRTALVDMGISTDRITTRGYGEEFPAADNATASGRRSNRRVEIIVSDNDGNITPR